MSSDNIYIGMPLFYFSQLLSITTQSKISYSKDATDQQSIASYPKNLLNLIYA